MKKGTIGILIIFLLMTSAFAQVQSNSAFGANRRTAIRYLQLAKQYAAQKQWQQADDNARLGLAYDDAIADLWYIRAVSQFSTGKKKAAVLPLVVTALTEAEWVDYNRDNARILYADLLSTMLQFDAALATLDSEPFLYSADAEYIRARCYYNMGSPYVQKAREKIDTARRIYPTDIRFAELFFLFEYRLNQAVLQQAASGRADESLDPLVRKIADAFILALSAFNAPDADLELYAAIFAEGEKQIRLLKSFKARNVKAPLYAEYAVRTGLLDQDAALDEFFAFADDKIALDVLTAFIPLITEEQPKHDLYEYLNAYQGRLTADAEGDGIENLFVDYNRGRPSYIIYDANQDDAEDWTVTCDFGVPQTIQLHDAGLELQYGNWPYILAAKYLMKHDTSLDFSVIGDTLRWTPFTMDEVAVVQTGLALDFFFPTLHAEIAPLSAPELLHASSHYTLPSQERPNALITVTLLDGVVQTARYSVAGILYAQAQFEDGIPQVRVVDTDGDGLFETTEFYGFDIQRAQTVLSVADEMQIITNLFGSPSSGTGLYVRMIQIDTNGDTIPDFTEEYQEGEGKIASWDTDGDGNWDVRYVKYAKTADGILYEESLFHQPLTDSVVTVSFENGRPVRVQDGDRQLPVSATKISNFYWIGQKGSEENAQKIVQAVNQTAGQGVSIIVGTPGYQNERMLGVHIGSMIFGEMLPESDSKDDEKK